MTKKSARKVEARTRQAKVGGKYTNHLRKAPLDEAQQATGEIILEFLRWLRTSGPNPNTSSFSEAFLAAEDRVEEYLKKPRTWRVDNMGWAIVQDVQRAIPTQVQMNRSEPFGDYHKWACHFTADNRSINMTVSPDTIALSTSADDKAVGYGDQVSAVQAILQHLYARPDINKLRKKETDNFDVVKEGSRNVIVKVGEPVDEPAEVYSPRAMISDEIRQMMARENVSSVVNSKSRLLGITDGKYAQWVPLTQVKNAPDFAEWWRTLPRAEPYDHAFPDTPVTILTKVRLEELFKPVQTRDDRVVRIWLSLENYAQLRKHARPDFEPTAQRDTILAGIVGYIWNAQVRASKAIPQGFLCLIGEKDGDADIYSGWAPTKEQLLAI